MVKTLKSCASLAVSLTLSSLCNGRRGYDAEWIHGYCREQWGVTSVIPAVLRRTDGTIGGHWRAQMTPEYLAQQAYQLRWRVESYFSALKRTMGSTLTARKPHQMVAEAALKVLAYALRR